MTNLQKVTEFLSSKTIATKQDKKIAIEEIAKLLNVTKNNASVYFTKASKLSQPIPTTTPKEEVVAQTYVEQIELINSRIKEIMEKANNHVSSL